MWLRGGISSPPHVAISPCAHVETHKRAIYTRYLEMWKQTPERIAKNIESICFWAIGIGKEDRWAAI